MSWGSGLSSVQVSRPSLCLLGVTPTPQECPLRCLRIAGPTATRPLSQAASRPAMCQPGQGRPASPWDHTCLPTTHTTHVALSVSSGSLCRHPHPCPALLPRKVWVWGPRPSPDPSTALPSLLHSVLYSSPSPAVVSQSHVCQHVGLPCSPLYPSLASGSPEQGSPRPKGQAPPSSWPDESHSDGGRPLLCPQHL